MTPHRSPVDAETGDKVTDAVLPLWLLDVDGVLNAVCMEPAEGYTQVKCAGFWITYRPALIDRIAALHRSGAVEIRWLTTWCEDAANLLAPLIALPTFAVEGSDDYKAAAGGYWWKAVTARRLVEGDPDRPLIWTDDDCGYANRLGELDWLADHPNKLVISPKVHTGITDEHMNEIESRCVAVSS